MPISDELDKQVQDLINHINGTQQQLNENSEYYESDHRLETIGIGTPPELRRLEAKIGWPRLYLDSIEERLDIEGFRLADQALSDERLWHWWQSNQMDEESGLAHLEAMIHGRAYITVAAPDPNDPTVDQQTPVIRVESPRSFYAEVDPRTNRVKQAIRTYRSPDSPDIDGATLLLPNSTVYVERTNGPHSRWEQTGVVNHGLGVPPVIPLLNRERLSDRDGTSEITNELRNVTDVAARTMMNMGAATELMAVPQRLLFGVSQEAFARNPDNPSAQLEEYYARILTFEDPETKAHQFDAAELQNFTNVLQELSKQAASYTGLPPQYLSFSSDNPASAEAIKSSESRLVKKCERKSRMFGGAWEEALRLGMLIIDGSVPEDAKRLETIWRDPSTPTYAAKADAAQKLTGGQPVIPIEQARVDMGYGPETRRQMRDWDKESPTSQLAGLVSQGPRSVRRPPAEDAA